MNGEKARHSLAAVVVVAAALWLPRLGAELARQTGLGEAFVGSLFVAVTTSLPEITVSLAAVRMGAVDLGNANVLGSRSDSSWPGTQGPSRRFTRLLWPCRI